MVLIGVEYLHAIASRQAVDGKMVINEHGAVFGPVTTQHRDLRTVEVRYADEYKGNALAAMLAPGRIELRYHAAFTDARVTTILRSLAREPGLALIADWTITYQGLSLSVANT